MGTQASNLDVRVRGIDELSPELNKLESRLIRFVGAIGAGIAAIKIGTAPIVSAAAFERELANVKKTTNFTSVEIQSLNKELLDMSTRVDVTALDLAKIAAAAGQQGLGREGVKGVVQFTESVSRMSSVLDLTAEKAAEDIGKVVNIFKIPLREIEKAVSTFNEVSNNSTAKGEELLDVVKRIGDAAGTLDLQQSTALAATGLDFGQSPEVVGTAFAKVFNSLTSKAKEFGALLQIETSAWIPRLQSNGLEAFKDVLAKLRELNPVDQQNAINKLFGGGRIGALINKLVQDVSNSVLEKNIASAATGKQGFSAVKEQATVLNTLTAQSKIAYNALIKLGIDASQQLLGPLTQYARDLQDVLKSPKLASFLNQLFAALGQTTGAVVSLLGWVADLNINWENFVRVAAAFALLKVAETFTGMTLKASGLAGAMKSISKDGEDAAKSINKLGTAAASASAANTKATEEFKGSWLAQKLGYTELSKAIEKNRQDKLLNERTTRDIASRQMDLASAQAAADQARNATRASFAQRQTAGEAVRQQRGVVTQAAQAAAQAEAAVQAQRQARIQQAEVDHQARLAVIETDYQARRQAIAATGTQTGLKALRAERATAIAEQEASNARSLRSIESYWTRRAAIVSAGARAQVDAERLALMQTTGRFDESANRQSANQRALDAATSRENAAQSSLNAIANSAAGVAATNAALGTNAGILARAQAGWAMLTVAVRTAGTVIATVATTILGLGAKLVNAFFWVTIIYSIADALGVLQKVMPAITWLTDKLGLTSAAQRDAAVSTEAMNKALEEQNRQLTEATRKYNEAKDAREGFITSSSAEALLTKATQSDSSQVREGAYSEFLQQSTGALKTLDAEKQKMERAVEAQTADLIKKIQQGNLQVTAIQRQAEIDAARIPEGRGDYKAVQEAHKTRILQITTAMRGYADQIVAIRERLPATTEEINNANKSLENLAKAAAASLTPESIKVVEELLLPLAQAKDEAAKLAEVFKTVAAGNAKLSETENKAAIAIAQKNLDDAEQTVSRLAANFRVVVSQMLSMPGLSEGVKKSLNDTFSMQGFSTENLKAILELMARVNKENLTGAKAGLRDGGSASGKGTFSPQKDEAAEARRAARARVALAKATNEFVRAQQEEGNKQILEADQRLYDKGLVDLETFYRNREAIQQQQIDNDITRRTEDIDALKREGSSGTAAERDTRGADIVRLLSEIEVLRKRKEGLRASTVEDRKNARQAFNDSVLSEGNKLAEDGLIPQSVVQRFEDTLEELKATARKKLSELGSNGRKDLSKAVEDALSVEAAAKAIKPNADRVSNQFAELDALKANLTQLRDAGVITSQELENGLKGAIQRLLPEISKLADESQALLDSMKNGPLAGSIEFQRLAQSVAATRTQITALGAEADTTARNINKGITDSLTDALANMRFTFNGIKDAARDLLISVANQIKQLFARNLAESIMQGLGSLGGGGIGGFISSVLGGSKKPDGTKSNPLYVQMGDSKGLSDLLNNPKDGMNDVFDALPGKMTSIFEGLKTTLSTIFESLQGGLGTVFSSLKDVLGSLFSSGGGGGGGGFFSWITSFFMHSGGTVGQSGLRRAFASPALFHNATRYHSGGQIGLKPGEVPIIAEEGEVMRTKRQERALQKRLANGGTTEDGGSMVNVWVVTPDQQPAVGPNDIVAVVSDNISRGGSIKKLIQQVNIGR